MQKNHILKLSPNDDIVWILPVSYSGACGRFPRGFYIWGEFQRSLACSHSWGGCWGGSYLWGFMHERRGRPSVRVWEGQALGEYDDIKHSQCSRGVVESVGVPSGPGRVEEGEPRHRSGGCRIITTKGVGVADRRSEARKVCTWGPQGGVETTGKSGGSNDGAHRSHPAAERSPGPQRRPSAAEEVAASVQLPSIPI